MTEQAPVRRDPFTSRSSKCDTCGRDLTDAAARGRGRCASCAEAIERGLAPDEARAYSDEANRVFQSAKIDGEPWWTAGRTVFVAAYPDLDALNLEAPVALDAGYEISAMTAMTGDLGLGRLAAGYWLAGAFGAMLASGRSESHIVVAWRKAGRAG